MFGSLNLSALLSCLFTCGPPVDRISSFCAACQFPRQDHSRGHARLTAALWRKSLSRDGGAVGRFGHEEIWGGMIVSQRICRVAGFRIVAA